jgi:enamine deaminase RidA (YjgF/YER057c/UK114 family)
MPKTYLNPPTLFPSQQYGFSQIVTSQGGTTVYLSGQVAWDAAEQIGSAGDLGEQTRRALENIEIAMQAAGGTRDDVVSLRIYLVGEHIHKSRPVREALLSFFGADRQPASTWIGVTALASPDFLVEIEAVAVIEPG